MSTLSGTQEPFQNGGREDKEIASDPRYREFSKILLQHYPNLLPREVAISILNAFGWLNYRTAAYLGMTEEAVVSAHHRIRIKMGLPKRMSIGSHVLSIMK
jgi:hypothetical protein